MSNNQNMPGPGAVYPHQEQPQPSTRRVQKSFAMQMPPNPTSPNDACYEGMLTYLGACFGILGSIPCICPCFPNPFKIVEQGNVGLISKFGKFERTVDPGLYKINPYCEQLRIIDVKMQVQDIPRQMVLTKDNVSLDIDSVLFFDIIDPFQATYQVQNVQQALIDRTQTTLRMVVGNRTLQDCIENREQLAQEIKNIIDDAAEAWGIRVESILLLDIILERELLNSMASAATQKRVGEAKVIAAQAEVASALLMREAADVLNSEAAMQIRYLETLGSMAKNPNTKTIFLPQGDGKLDVKSAQVLEHIGGGR